MGIIRYFHVLVFFAGLFGALLISSCASKTDKIYAQHGVLSAPDWQFKDAPPLPLAGEWDVIWGELVEPDEFEQQFKGLHFNIPGLWNGVEQAGIDGSYGVASFRLKLDLPRYDRTLSYHVVSPNAAWRLYLDGVYVGGNGVVTKDPDQFKSHYISRFFTSDIQTRTLVLQVANHSHAYGGPEYAITVSDAGRLEQRLHFMSICFVLALGTLFSIGLIHLIFYLADRKHREQGTVHLWFSLLCFILVIRISGIIPYFHLYTPEAGYWSDLKLTYLTLFAAPAVYLLFFRSAFPNQFPKKTTQYLIWFGVLMTGFVLITPENIYTHTRDFSVGFNVFVILYCLIFTAVAVVKKRSGAGAILIANFLFLLTALHDAVLYTNHGNGFDMTPFGFMMLGLGYSYALLLRLQRTFNQARQTSGALEKLNRKLEQRVRERTKAFKLAAAKAENNAQDKMKFMAAASHDLRQPLHALSLFNLAIKNKITDPDIEELVSKQGQSIRNMENLLQDTLDAAKADHTEIDPVFTRVHVVDLVEKIVTGYEVHAQNSGLQLIENIEEGFVSTHPVMLQRILSNLIDNALKAARHCVEINVENKETEWLFHVKDDGRGIKKSDMERIFEPYISLDDIRGADDNKDNRQDEKGGFGLGLYVVSVFSKQIGAAIKISTTPDKGSTFTLSVPQAGVDDFPKDSTAEHPPFNMPTKGWKILAIDDEQEILNAMQAMLDSWDCYCETASDLEQAQAILSSGYEPDILLVDYHLRHENGLVIVEKLRSHNQRDYPAVIITGATEIEILATIKQAGMTVLQKPIDPNKLIAVLNGLPRG